MNTYSAYLDPDGELIVEVNGLPLPKRMDIHHYSQTYTCGFGGAGALQLSLALLAYHLRNDDKALRLSEPFAWKMVARLPRTGWTITDRHIEEVIAILTRDIHPP